MDQLNIKKAKKNNHLVVLDIFLILVAALVDPKTALILVFASLLFFWVYNLAEK
ncbi:MAG: hypothetical protein WC465_04140 [Patescibacteria group bacterium]